MRFLLLLLLLSLPEATRGELLDINLQAEAALLINADTGAVLFHKKARKRMYPASLTKIATALYTLKLRGEDLKEEIAAQQECIGSVTEEAKQRSNYTMPSYLLVKDCSHMGIKKGEKLSLFDLMYGMMVASADDASNMIAHTLGKGSIPDFMKQLNEYLSSIGCKDTHFNNPHGLYHPQHYTTAFDLAIMAKEAMKNPFFRKMVATKKHMRPKTNKQSESVLLQTNRLLRNGEFHYSKAIGIKTGYIAKAGNTLVAAAQEGKRTLIAVLLNVKERREIFKNAIALFEAAFNQPLVERKIVSKGNQRYTLEIPGASVPIKTAVKEDVILTYYPAEEPKVRASIKWDYIKAPISKGAKIGELLIKDDQNRLLKTTALFAQENVSLKWTHQIRELFVGSLSRIVFWIVFILILYGFYRFARR